MRKTAVRKAFRNWERAKEARANSERSYEWAVERWEKLPITIEQDRQALTAPQSWTSTEWKRTQLALHEEALAGGKGEYLQPNNERLTKDEAAQQDAFTILSNYVQGYVHQNLKVTVEIFASSGPHDESTKLIINRTKQQPSGEIIDLVELARRIITPKTRVIERDKEPREIKAKRDGDQWITTSERILAAMKSVRGVVIFGQVTVEATRLRQYMQLINRNDECLRITPATEGGVIGQEVVEISDERHTAHFKHRQDMVYKGPTELRFVGGTYND